MNYRKRKRSSGKYVTCQTWDPLLKKLHPKGRLLMRIVTNDVNSMHSLSVKFGAKRAEWRNLILKCKEIKLNLVGIAFHVGSGSRDPQQFIDSFIDASLGFSIFF